MRQLPQLTIPAAQEIRYVTATKDHATSAEQMNTSNADTTSAAQVMRFLPVRLLRNRAEHTFHGCQAKLLKGWGTTLIG